MKKFLCAFLASYLICLNAFAQPISIIRDAEAEDFLRELSRPIFEAANLDSKNVKIYIVNDSNLNAFVAGGQNVFINTGLITRHKHPDILMGVIAHEAGHIASGHLARSNEEMKKTTNAMVLTYIAGIVAAIAARSDAAYAVIMGGTQINQRLALKYNRGQEEAADQLALRYLDKLNYSSIGLLKLLAFFNKDESALLSIVDEYALTHPISRKRMSYLQDHIIKSGQRNNQKINQKLQPKMDMVIAKLESFLKNPDEMLQDVLREPFYKNNTRLAKYASCIAYFKKGKIRNSLHEIDELIKSDKNNGYFWELKGQILYESGNLKEAIIAYKKAAELKDDNSLAKISLASAIISLNSSDKGLLNFAIDSLNSALLKEGDNPEIFKQLSLAYSQNNNEGRAYLALAELNLLQDDTVKVKKYAKLAKKQLDKNDKSALLKADDILATVKEPGDK